MKTLFLKSNLLHLRTNEGVFEVSNPEEFKAAWIPLGVTIEQYFKSFEGADHPEWPGEVKFIKRYKGHEGWSAEPTARDTIGTVFARLLPKENKENKICIASHGPVSESAYKELEEAAIKQGHVIESPEPQEKPRRQEFEKYPVLTEHISRMYHTGYIGSLIEWSNFLQELNRVLKASAPSESQEELSYDKIRSEYLNHRGRIWTKEEVMLKWIIENYKLITRKPE